MPLRQPRQPAYHNHPSPYPSSPPSSLPPKTILVAILLVLLLLLVLVLERQLSTTSSRRMQKVFFRCVHLLRVGGSTGHGRSRRLSSSSSSS